jgi:hypothetical protein
MANKRNRTSSKLQVKRVSALLALALILTGCANNGSTAPTVIVETAESQTAAEATQAESTPHIVTPPETLPAKGGDPSIVPTDYSNDNNWLYIDTNSDKEVDVFYLYPTAWQRRDGEEYLSSIDNLSLRAGAKSVFATQATVYMEAGNVYAPYYRQLDAFWTLKLDSVEQKEYLMGATYLDAVAAFEYYLENYNKGKPFILAGHSQGSNVLKFMLEYYMGEHPEVFERMVAAYIIGYSITQDDLDANPHMKFAEGETDTGVIISWNTEAPDMTVENLVVSPGALVINPLSWSRDEDTVSAALHPGSRFYAGDGSYVDRYSLCDATVNKERGVVICSTIDPEDYLAPGGEGLFPKGVLHGQDYPFYWHAIEENAVARAKAYLANNNGQTAAHIEDYAAEIITDIGRYALINETMDWNEAKAHCEELGGHLATITSQEEQDTILALLSSIGDDKLRNCYFLGGADMQLDGNWQWVTGEAFTYTDWKTNEPKPDKGEQYLEIFAKTYEGNSGITDPGKWNDCMVDSTPYSGAGEVSFFTPDQTGFICEWN